MIGPHRPAAGRLGRTLLGASLLLLGARTGEGMRP